VLFFFQVALLVDDGDAALLAERRVGDDDAEPLARIAGQAVDARLDRASRSGILPLLDAAGSRIYTTVDAVQVEVHDAEAGHVGHQLPALHELRSQVLLLVLVQLLAKMLDDVAVGRQQEAAGSCARIADRVVGPVGEGEAPA